MVVITQLYQYMINYWIWVNYCKWVNWVVSEFHFNNRVIKNQKNHYKHNNSSQKLCGARSQSPSAAEEHSQMHHIQLQQVSIGWNYDENSPHYFRQRPVAQGKHIQILSKDKLEQWEPVLIGGGRQISQDWFLASTNRKMRAIIIRC